jgi:Mn-dependent DtxR family transcriptional regulator
MPRTLRHPSRRRQAGRDVGRHPPSASTEDYLERIGELIERDGSVRMGEIARALGVRPPSVTAMVRRLAQAGYVEYARYREVVLTPKGRGVGIQMRHRHATLKRFLALLGLDERTQENDIEGWEHCLSVETLRRLAGLVAFLEAKPRTLRELQKNLAIPADPQAPS